VVGIYTAWQSGDEAPHRAWADGVEAALKPYALESSYPNYFGTDRPQQALQTYGQNTDRLLRLKARYDQRTCLLQYPYLPNIERCFPGKGCSLLGLAGVEELVPNRRGHSFSGVASA